MAEETLNRTRVGVTRASHSEQVPWISSSLAEDFSFIPGARPQPPTQVAVATPPRLDPAPAPPAVVNIPPPPPPPKIELPAAVTAPPVKDEATTTVASLAMIRPSSR